MSEIGSLSPQAEFGVQAAAESAVNSQAALRELLFAVAVLVLAATLCVYGFVKIVPLALAYQDAAPTSTASPMPQ